MGDRVSAGLQTVPNVVFIYTTAGDGGDSQSFWLPREQAAQAAVDALTPAGTWTCASQVVNGHSILRCAKGAAVCYNMRLPDGGNGSGFLGRGSLAMLRDGGQATLTAIDGSATYSSWADLTNTIRAIIDLEGANQAAPYVEVHSPDYDRTLNPRDHTDNYATGDLTHDAAATRSWNISWYVDYDISNRAINLTQAAHDIKRLAFYAYDNYMGSRGLGREQYDQLYQDWLWRTYYRSTVSTPPLPPAAPTGLQAVAFSSSRIDLTWTDNATNETGYTVERAPDNSGVPGTYAQIASLAGNATTYQSTALDPVTTYWYRVRAFNAGDVSGYSNAVSGTTLQRPATPTNLQAQPISTTRIDLIWTDNATNETSYVVERAPDNAGVAGTFTQIVSLPAGSTAYSNTGLAANTAYWYRVRALTANDASSYSTAVSALTPQGPAAPTNLVATAISSSQINLTWTDNTTAETGYTVERAPTVSGVAGTYAAIANLPANSVSYNDVSLTQNTRYWYRVRAFNTVDVSAYSAEANATTLQAAPAAPTALQLTVFSTSRIDLRWTDHANDETGFRIERAPDNGGTAGVFAEIATVGANVVTYSNTGLAPSTPYWYRVRAYNGGGNSAYTNSATATTLAPNAPRLDVYVQAHQDDWQLFMGYHAYTSSQTASNILFIYTTAGDGGASTTTWLDRELAAQASVDALIGAGNWTCAAQTINAHSIRRCAKGKAVSYDMRLGDGNTNGAGFNGHGSLALLRDGGVSTLTAIDGSTTYTSWSDLTATMGAIIDFESAADAAPSVQVHSPDYDRTINSHDHTDHLASSDLVTGAAATRSWTRYLYIDYHTQDLAQNITAAQRDIKRATFNAYDNYMGSRGYGYEQYDTLYQIWLFREYVRTP
jgi:hypothetical protein